MSSCVEEIFLFQKKLNKYARLNEADKVLYYIHKLNHLNVTVGHLEETGVGKTVNALRHQGGKVGEKARGLVNKWKAMVTAEEEEEEEEEEEAGENEEEAQARVEAPTESRNEEKEALDDQEEVEDEEDEEENCLQIEENDSAIAEEYEEPEEEPQPPTAAPHSTYGYSQGGSSGSEEEDTGVYNPLTSRRDYQSHIAVSVAEYHPTATSKSPRDASSPEWGGASPGAGRDWKNGSSAKSSGKKNSREEKEHSREREKHRSKGKGRHRERSGSQEKERRKDHHKDKHKDKHREREEKKEEAEEERKIKSHKDKHRDREKHHARSRENKHKGDDDHEKSNHEKDGSASVVNGFNTPDHRDRGSYSKRESRESDKSMEERQRERVEEGHYQRGESTSRESLHHENRSVEWTKSDKESGKERHRDGSKKEKHKREHRDRDESPVRQRKEKKNRHHATEDEGSSVSLNSVNREDRAGERTGKDGKGKHKEDKHRHKDSSGKKDKHKKDLGIRQEVEEQQSGGERTKKDKKTKQESSMDSGFGAVLMGLDSPVKKKKKKKKKEAEKERDSCSEDEQPSTSGACKRGPASNAGLPDTKKPKLLSTSLNKLPKLPSLDVTDEKPLLPEITPNYKPLPRLPVREEPPESSLAKMTEEEALNLVFQSKYNRRSKVYSGKVSGLAYVPSLYEICIRVLQENIDALEYTGGIPFEILRPVLERATPKQLLNLEDYNHYLLEDSDVLWETHCKRDFKNEKLEEMESWREMWLRCSEERDRKLRNLTHNLTEKFRTKAEPKRTTKIAYVDVPAKVPKGVARAQAKYGTAAASALAAKPGKANEVAARKTAMQNVQRAERAPNPRPVAAKKKKVAPLMAKTRQFFKKAFRR